MTTTAEKTIIAWIHGYMQNKHRFSLTQYLTCNCSCVLEASITWFHYFNTKCLVKVQCIPIFIFEPNVTKTEANNEKYHYDFPDIYIQSSSHSALSSSFATVPSIVLYACRSTWKHLCHLSPTETINKSTNSICVDQIWKHSQAVLLLYFTTIIAH